jgi:hypothetical protein
MNIYLLLFTSREHLHKPFIFVDTLFAEVADKVIKVTDILDTYT